LAVKGKAVVGLVNFSLFLVSEPFHVNVSGSGEVLSAIGVHCDDYGMRTGWTRFTTTGSSMGMA